MQPQAEQVALFGDNLKFLRSYYNSHKKDKIDKRRLRRIRKDIESSIKLHKIARLTADVFGAESLAYKRIMGACKAAADEHWGKKRENGQPLIVHERWIYVCAVKISGIRDVDMLVSIFLHDLVEDYESWSHFRVARNHGFFNKVPLLVFAVTKPPRLPWQTKKQHDIAIFERVRFGGVRACILKVHDRFHNMDTLTGTFEKRARVIRQTIEYVIPMSKEVGCLYPELEWATLEQIRLLLRDVRRHDQVRV
ncbi:hypothetical protein KC926_00965 [Candidatus Kaiserbacteria bacterium]|nr:hypothetical protein [Candidatus Kaiserbacteria bacterium]